MLKISQSNHERHEKIMKNKYYSILIVSLIFSSPPNSILEKKNKFDSLLFSISSCMYVYMHKIKNFKFKFEWKLFKIFFTKTFNYNRSFFKSKLRCYCFGIQIIFDIFLVLGEAFYFCSFFTWKILIRIFTCL